jgi:hypothetical protein
MLVVMFAAAVLAVPPALDVPSTATLSLRAEGRGVQIYDCEPEPDAPGAYAWRFKAPHAALYTFGGRMIGTHSAGPTWEGFDGGKVVGQQIAKAPSPDGAAIDWLLLSAKSANGVGALGKTSYVRRVRTMGGLAPQGGCSSSTLGSETAVSYTAEYDFYRTR